MVISSVARNYLNNNSMEKESVVSRLAKRIFLNRNTSTSNWLILQHCLEALFYLYAVHDCPNLCSYLGFDMLRGVQISLLLIALLVIRGLTGMSLIKIVSPVVLCLVISQVTTSTIPIVALILFLTLILTVGDVISNVSMDFNPSSIYSETINLSKMLHPIVLFYGILTSIVWSSPYAHLGSTGLFIMLAVLKNASMMRSSSLKEIVLRLYFLLACDHVVMFAAAMISLPVAFQWVAPPIISQFLYQLFKLRKKSVKLDELYSQQNFFKLAFKISSYLESKNSDPLFQAAIEDFVGDRLLSPMKQVEKKLLIYDKLIEILNRQKKYENELLKANIFLLNGCQLLKCKYTIESLKKRVGWSPIRRILLWRIQQLLFEFYENKDSKISFEYFESYFKCDQFRTMLIRAATHHIHLMEYSKHPDIIIEKLRKMSDRAIDYEDEIQEAYADIQHKCTTISILYSSYLFEVKKDRAQARKILYEVSFNEDFEIYLGINNKVFIEFDLEDKPLNILKISHNCSTLLGYERQELEGQSHEVFLPEFYRKTHKEMVDKQVAENINSMSLYKKKTIIKTKENYYRECDLGLRMTFSIGGKLHLHGFLYLRDNQEFLWEDYFFINDNQQIIECGQNLVDYQPTKTEFHHVTKLIQEQQNPFGESNCCLIERKGYYHLLSFVDQSGSEETKYFVRKAAQKANKGNGLSANKLSVFLGAMTTQKDEPPEVKAYNKQAKAVIQSIFSKQYIVLFLLILSLLALVLAGEATKYGLALQKESYQNNILNRTGDIIYWYTNLTKLEVGLNYFDLNQQIGYNNDFTKVNILSRTLDFHFINERLRSLSKATYILPSIVNGTTYSADTFQLSMKIIASAYIICKFDGSDPFLKNLTIENYRNTLNVMNYDALSQYQNQFLIEIQQKSQNYQILNLVYLIGIGSLLIAIYVALIRGQHKTRVNEQEAFDLFCNGHFQEQTIDSCQNFIRKITREQIKASPVMGLMGQTKNSKLRKEQTSFAPDFTATDREYTKSQMSMRQLSGRNLMDQSVIGKSFFAKQAKSKGQQSFVNKKVIVRVGKRNKKLFIVPLVLSLAVILALSINLIYNENVMSFDEKQSAEHVLLFFQQSYGFSRGVNGFFNFLNLRLAGASTNTTRFVSNPTALLSAQGSAQFQELSFSEFNNFEAGLIQLEYSYMCSYMSCDSRFYNEINIIYTATIQKLLKVMNGFITSFNTMTVTQLKTNLTSTTTQFQLDLFLYSEGLIRDCVNAILSVHAHSYIQYSNNLLMRKQLLIGIAAFLSIVGVILFIVLVVRVWRGEKKLARIVDVFKLDDEREDEKEREEKNNMPMMEVTRVVLSQ